MISGLSHTGIGVRDMDSSSEFYREFLGFETKICDLDEYLEQMEPIIGDLVKMRIVMVHNGRGGGMVELVQHTSTPLRPETTHWGDIGFLANGYRVDGLSSVVSRLEDQGARFVVRSHPTELASGERWESAFLSDPDGNLIELIDASPEDSRQPAIYGLAQVTIGVRDMDRSLEFYRTIIDYDEVLLDTAGREPSLDPVFEGELRQRQVVLRQSQPLQTDFAMPDGGTIRLVHVSDYEGKDIFAGRRWGDIGQMEACLIVDDLRDAMADLQAKNVEIFHPPTFIDLGSGITAYFAYIKDPDGNLIEFVGPYD